MLALSAVEREPPREGGRSLIHIPHSAIRNSAFCRSPLPRSLFNVRRWTLGVERLLRTSAFPFLPVGFHRPNTSH